MIEIKVPAGEYPLKVMEEIVQRVLEETDPEQLDWSVGIKQVDPETIQIHLMSVN